jgi:hypothetical protein
VPLTLQVGTVERDGPEQPGVPGPRPWADARGQAFDQVFGT